MLLVDPYCPVKIFKEFQRHRPHDALDESARFYLTPLRKPKEDVWYSVTPMGKNKIGTICKQMFAAAGIPGRKTNHSARRKQ